MGKLTSIKLLESNLSSIVHVNKAKLLDLHFNRIYDSFFHLFMRMKIKHR
jgi:hypothetical protein